MSTSSPRLSSLPPGARRNFRGLSPEERQNQRRTQLMEAGLEVFGTRGFHAAGVRDICAQAKLTERYFYESFKNREALFLAVFQAAVTRMEQTVYAALHSVAIDSDRLARTALRATLETYRADPRIARILLVEVFSAGAGELPFAVNQSFAATIEKLTAALYPDLAARKLNARLVANGLYGSTIYISQRWTLDGFREPLEQILDHCALFYEAVAVKMASPAATRAAASRAPAKRTRRNA